jgi:cyclic pyranopterin phosphate synthase
MRFVRHNACPIEIPPAKQPGRAIYCTPPAGQHKLIAAAPITGKITDKMTGKKDIAPRLTHLDDRGRVKMVDVGGKPVTRREAVARGAIAMRPETLDAIIGGTLKKGEALAAARIAGIMAAKRTHELIPLCHQIALEVVEVDFRPDRANSRLEIQTRAVTDSRTGVEMEALLAASAAALAIYDMAKAIDRAMTIDAIRLVRKSGGRGGDFARDGESEWTE